MQLTGERHRDVNFEMGVRRAEVAAAERFGAAAKTWYDSRKKRAT